MKMKEMAAGLFLGLLGIVAVAARGTGAEQEGRSFYTLSNLWYERGSTIDTVYHSGDMIPMATLVRIDIMRDDRIVFSTGDGASFTMPISPYIRKTTTLEELFGQCFSDKDPLAPGAAFHKLNKMEQRNVADGTLALGMSKAAVLMSYGYPPSHKTPNIADKTWRYWKKKMRDFAITFDDNDRVSDLEKY